MAERTVKVKLVADVSDYTAGLVKAAAATKGLAGDVEKNLDRDLSPAMKRAGDKQGGVLAQGVRTGLVRNSPLIAAAVGAALAAGAPVALAGAAVMFGGIGALAASQSTSVREAWMDTWSEIRDGAVSDAAVLGPTFERMADKIGAAFQRMRPEIRDAFEDAAPQIERFTDGLTGAAENALPGLIRAVERGGPVIDGLASLMEDVGTGLSDFFDAMSDNSESAGAALEGLGDVLGAALPLLGELLGTGSEIAADVLPPLADALGVVADIAHALGPVLPAVAAGFASMKIATTAAGWIGTFTDKVKAMPVAMAGVTSPLGALAVAVAGVVVLYENATSVGQKWADAIREGGKAAADARAKMADFGEASREVNSGWAGLLAGLVGTSATIGGTAIAMDEAKTAAAELAAEQDELAAATGGVTQAMLDQANVAMAAANSDYAYRSAVEAISDAMNDVSEAQRREAEAAKAVAEAQREHGRGSKEAADAQRDLATAAEGTSDAVFAVEGAALRSAEAARQLAFDTSTASSEAGKNAEADAAMLAELLRLQGTMGGSFPAALNTTIARLQNATNTAQVTSAAMDQLNLSVQLIPGSKDIRVNAPTEDQRARLQNLGFTVTNIPGTKDVTVSASTGAARDALNSFVNTHWTTTIFAGVKVSGVPAKVTGGAIGGIVHQYARGGFEPMRGGVAQVVGPNTWRVIGDRARDDEAYIPINNDARSHEILQQTAERMGYGIGREASASAGGGVTIDYDRLAAAVGGRGGVSIGQVVTQRNETGFELAERLAFSARTGG